jgi:hypothetical protein
MRRQFVTSLDGLFRSFSPGSSSRTAAALSRCVASATAAAVAALNQQLGLPTPNFTSDVRDELIQKPFVSVEVGYVQASCTFPPFMAFCDASQN